SAFVLEYKVQTQNGPAIAATSIRQVFPASSESVTVTVPISYDGAISELAINFVQVGDAAQLKIDAIRFGG
ncbi:hypothetical protein G4A30_28660, partial [Escherichia coli]|uniref:hypothetical protein n=1 Tax=Escherichia coli TaxID=562 RepID=UPI0015CE807E